MDKKKELIISIIFFPTYSLLMFVSAYMQLFNEKWFAGCLFLFTGILSFLAAFFRIPTLIKSVNKDINNK